MRRRIIGIGFVVLGFAGCSRFHKGEGDMRYEIIDDVPGAAIREGEVVELSVTARTEEDSVLWSSADYDRPALVRRERSVFRGDLFAALGLLSEGDSAVVMINIDSMEAKMGVRRPGGTKGRYLVYSLRIGRVVHKGKLPDSLYTAEVDKFYEAFGIKIPWRKFGIKYNTCKKQYESFKKLTRNRTGLGFDSTGFINMSEDWWNERCKVQVL